MKCTHCGAEINEGAKFCKACGEPVSFIEVKNTPSAVQSSEISDKSLPTIKCGNCGYIGEGQPARRLVFTVLAWLCVVFAPLITIIYFVGTHKYRCPRCKSTFIGIKNKEGVFVGQRGGTSKVLSTILLVILGIAILGIMASVVLASLNTARQKGEAAQGIDWATLTSPDGRFTVELPKNPEYSPDDTKDAVNGYSYTATEKDENIYYIVKYEDYHQVAVEEGVDLAADENTSQKFLKGLADSTVEEYKLSDFSSQFITSHGHTAIKFGGDITVDGEKAHLEGTIILVGDTTYHVISLANEGYTSQFDRVVSSLTLNQP